MYHHHRLQSPSEALPSPPETLRHPLKRTLTISFEARTIIIRYYPDFLPRFLPQQEVEYEQHLVSGGVVQREIALVVLDEEIGAGGAQQTDGPEVPEHGRDVHRREAIPVAHVNLS